MSFPAYDEYKDSNVGWLGKIPSNWDVVALKYIVSLKSGDGITGESIEETGEYPVYGGNGLRGYTDDFTHDGHYVVIGRQGALCGNINYANGRFWASEHAVVASPFKPVDTIWLGEMLRAMNLNQYSISAAQPGLSMESVGNLRTVLPPLDEQKAISSFLDVETSKIDGLVSEQRRLIALLKEKRQAVISHAVTKGLNPNAPMKPSGIQLFGDVPEHWEVMRLKYLTPQITVGIVVEPSKFYVDDGVPALRSLNVDPREINRDNLVYISEEANELHSKSKIYAGDLVAVRSGQTGTTAVVPAELDGCNCIDLIIIRRPTDGSEWFLCWFLASDAAVAQFSLGSGGAIQQHFNIGTAMHLIVPTPPRNEQHEIADYIRQETTRIDTLIAEAERAIELLQERRTALISAAVTGKIDVRASAPVSGKALAAGSSALRSARIP